MSATCFLVTKGPVIIYGMYWVGTQDSLQNYKENVAHFVELKKAETCRSILKFLDGPSLPNKRVFSFGKIPQSNPFSYNSGPQQA